MLADGSRVAATTGWCSPPAASRRCRRSAGWCGSTAGCTRRCTPSAPWTTASRLRRARCPARAATPWSSAAGCSGSRSPARSASAALATEVVEGGEHLLRSQVGATRRRDPGPRPASGSAPRSTPAPAPSGSRRPRPARSDNGFTLDTDLVVLTAGGRPSTALARRAGLDVRRGIVVDHHLRTSDDPTSTRSATAPQHGGQVTGFVPPAWEQAGLLARHLDRRGRRVRRRRTVARLRATDLDVAVLGDPEKRRRARSSRCPTRSPAATASSWSATASSSPPPWSATCPGSA